MFRTVFERKIVKFTLILSLVLSIFILVLFDNRYQVLAGLLIGTGFGILRFGSMASLYTRFLNPSVSDVTPGKAVFRYILNQLSAVLLLASALVYDVGLFFGMVAGVLEIPFVVMVFGSVGFFSRTNKDNDK